ncbi:hypothetical protein IWW38_005277, partial [Coemansia aciculifera]
MSDEKRVKFVVHSDGTIPVTGDIETGHLLEEGPQQPERRQCRGRLFLAKFFKVFLIYVCCYMVGRMIGRAMFSENGLRKLWRGCDGMGEEHPHH